MLKKPCYEKLHDMKPVLQKIVSLKKTVLQKIVLLKKSVFMKTVSYLLTRSIPVFARPVTFWSRDMECCGKASGFYKTDEKELSQL